MQSIFPASYSTPDALALAPFVEKAYGLKNVQCEFLVRGVGDTYLVISSHGRFILRIYRSTHRSLAQITAETELLAALKQAGVSVSYPVADVQGNCIQSLQAAEGLRHAVLFTYAAGNSAAILNEQQLCSLGYEMAKFHNVSSTIHLSDNRWNFNTSTTLFKPLEMLKHAFETYPEGYAWLQDAAKRAQQHLSKINTSGFSAGYCHFDFLPKNFHFDDAGKVTFFDFDFFGSGWLVNDVMTFWVHLCLDVFFGRLTQKAADNAYTIFVEAYRTHRPLTGEELAAVPYLSLGFWLFYMGFHTTHDQFYPFIQPAQLKMRTGVIKGLIEKYWPREG